MLDLAFRRCVVSEPRQERTREFGATAVRLGRCYPVLAEVVILAGEAEGHRAVVIPALVTGGQVDSGRESGVVSFRWGWCPADRLLHLLDSVAVRAAVAVGWAEVTCGLLIFAAGLTLRGDSVGMCVSWGVPLPAVP